MVLELVVCWRIFSQSVSPYQDNMGVSLNISLLLSLGLLSLTGAASLQEENSQGEGRFLFANYTSGEAPPPDNHQLS